MNISFFIDAFNIFISVHCNLIFSSDLFLYLFLRSVHCTLTRGIFSLRCRTSILISHVFEQQSKIQCVYSLEEFCNNTIYETEHNNEN